MHTCIGNCRPRYARRTNKAGQTEYMMQCVVCLYGVKHEDHDGKLFINHKDIPLDQPIHPWITTPLSGGESNE